MGRFMRELRDAFRRQPAEAVPLEPPAPPDPPAKAAEPPTTTSEPDSAAVNGIHNDESKPTLMVKNTRAGLDDLITGRHSVASDVVDGFKIVPEKMSGISPTPDKPHWRVEFAFDDISKLPLRLQIAEAAVIGRGNTCHIPLDEHNAEIKGISRNHAMLRPSSRALFFFDLESTNGSHHNGIPMGAGMAMSLSLGDVIRLGSLNLTIRRIERIG